MDGEQQQHQQSRRGRGRQWQRQRQRRRLEEEIGVEGGRGYCDLYVPCPPAAIPRRRSNANKSASNTSSDPDEPPPVPPPPLSLLVSSLLDRFRSTKVTTIALTHTVYGGVPHPVQDAVDRVFPSHWIQEWEQQRSRSRTHQQNGSTGSTRPLRILTRLHAVVESASDLRHYQRQQQQPDDASITNRGGGGGGTNRNDDIVALLRAYDLVSVAPRNDAVFQAACEISQDAALFDLLTLEYYASSLSGRAILPFHIKAGHVKSACRNGRAMEIPYAPALVNHSESASSYRRAFVQTLHELRSASLGVNNLRVIVSSGPRGNTARPTSINSSSPSTDPNVSDVGPLALRMPGDVKNWLTSLLKWEFREAKAALTANPQFVVHGPSVRRRQFGTGTAPTIRSVREEHSSPTGASDRSEPVLRKEKRRRTTTTTTTGTASEGAAMKQQKVEGTHDPDDDDDDDCRDAPVVEDGFISLN